MAGTVEMVTHRTNHFIIFAFMDIVVLDGYCLNPGDLSWRGFETLGGVTIYDRTPHELLRERAKDAEILITNKTIIDDSDMQELPALRYIGVLATGYNVVDIDAARRRGIAVTNIPAYSTMSVAQMVFAHILNITQHVADYSRWNNEGTWCQCADFSYMRTPLLELAGKTLALVGLGNTGMATARIAHAFGMKVIALTSKKGDILPPWIESVEKDALFARADILSLHCPLNDSTRHFINRETLGLMKPSAVIINCGRGPLIDEEALANALKTKRIMAAGLDVLSQEPPSPDNPLLGVDNCYITPHIAWSTTEARSRLMTIATDNIKAFMEGVSLNRIV